MDPMSLASGAAGLITLAAAVLSQCYMYGCAVANAPEEAKRLVSELTNLSGILVSIQGLHTSKFISEKNGLIPTLRECKDALQHALQRLESVNPQTKHSSLKWIRNRLLWPLERQDTLELLASVERQKSALNLSLGNITT